MDKNTRPNSCSIIIPVYNGADTITELTSRLMLQLPDVFQSFEIIFVNDGSPDNSWPVIQSLVKTYPEYVRGIHLRRNFGQHNAILCGVREAAKELIVTMDDDLQHPPEEIIKLYKALTPDVDVVYGIPAKLPHSKWRNFFSQFTKKLLAKVMHISTIRDLSSFRLFRTDIRNAFATYQNPGVILDVLLSWGTTRFTTIHVNEEPRHIGVSNYNFSSLASQALLILTGFSTFPLRFATWLGFFSIFAGILLLAYVLLVTLMAGSVPGFPFLSSLIIIFSGVQLFTLGLFGEYLGRIFDSSMQRPPYVVGEKYPTP